MTGIDSNVVYHSILKQIKSPCDSIIVTSLTVIEPVQAYDTFNICEGDDVQFADDSLFENVTQDFSYSFKLKRKHNGCDSIVSSTVQVTTIDTAVTRMGDVLTASDSAGTYQWIDCKTGQGITGAPSRNYVVTKLGEYAVEITKNTCKASSACFLVEHLTVEQIGNHGIRCYPNPSDDGVFLIALNADIDLSKISVLSAQGQMLNFIAKDSGDLIQLKLNHGPGVYYLQLMSGNQWYVQKLVVY